MRNVWLLLLLALVILIVAYFGGCFPCGCFGTCPPSSKGNDICADSTYKDSVYCRQIITQGPQSPAFKAKLDKFGFRKIDSCDCDADFALWESASHVVVELITEPPQEKAGGKVGGVGGDIFCINIPLHFNRTNSIIGNSLVNRDNAGKQLNEGDTNIEPVQVAVVDSGVDSLVPSIENYFSHDNAPYNSGCGTYPQVSPLGLNMGDKMRGIKDINNHGTVVNTILADYSNIFSDYSWQSERESKNIRLAIRNVRFTDGQSLNGSLFKAICGMYYAIKKGAKVINVSWGFYADGVPIILKPVLQYAQEKDVLIVAGVGNHHIDIDGSRSFWPAAFARDTMSYLDNPSKKIKNVLSVGGYKASGTAHDFLTISDSSNYGANSVSVYALGQDVLTVLAIPSGQAALGSGTSFATPFVTRTAAILRGLKPRKSASDIKQCVIDAAAQKVYPTSGLIGNIKVHNHALALTRCN